ncbi:hypothetical protein [Pseudomonas sp. McL0111]|uniref:hypothetical protein n=1 Tax=Pseudomonas sp. McL0111 TaxID=3457357 RepID=UPI00403EC6D7
MTNAATNPQTRISIKGVPRKYDANELLQRQQGFHAMYRSTDQNCEMVRGELPYLFLTKVIEKVGEGYILTDRYPLTMSNMNYHCHMTKPQHLQTADLAIIDEKVKQDYIVELEAELVEYRKLLTQQLLEKAELAEQKKISDKRAKLLADVEREVSDVFGEQLVVPD